MNKPKIGDLYITVANELLIFLSITKHLNFQVLKLDLDCLDIAMTYTKIFTKNDIKIND